MHRPAPTSYWLPAVASTKLIHVSRPDLKRIAIQKLRPTQQVDPIEYAWSLCNQGISLPAVLARGAFRDPTLDRMGGKLTSARMAIHSGILRRRMPRQHGVS